ncbi:hypothetical protein BBBOND_0108850 [Babesia bigemina]|uniref:Uncharacterized protein n=1 Tax=Babesia bigemina TaxID=5866 RepID=A0A061D3C7_BABBI|nr:hypothetical protein BBBOND_0108850 [Babesia bigemina]CDR94587.1 hypothetical protein BBBOND_0108850 [Babesia bigemina]|eukprot:XP_012766773.1 hypothetical protein BBBOND_0108850 [Babesia bigemina]
MLSVLGEAEGTGSGSGSVEVGELRGVGAAAAVVEGTGSHSGSCCSWLRGLGGEDELGEGQEAR